MLVILNYLLNPVPRIYFNLLKIVMSSSSKLYCCNTHVELTSCNFLFSLDYYREV